MSKIITPDNPLYNEARQIWNRSIQKYPDSIFYCNNFDDVSKAVCLARKCNLNIRIRSGGHNYEGYSIANNALIIDISKLNKMDINYKDNTVTVEGGVNNGQLYNFIGSKGYPFPGGACPTVGLSGYTLGGGWGYSCRYLGLGCDSLLEIKLINYKGNLITANKNINSSLFWACRGAGGGNFGVIVSMKYKLPKPVNKVTLFEIYYSNVSKCEQIKYLDTWQYWITNLDDRLTMNSGLYNTLSDGLYIYGRGIFYGPPEDLNKLLDPFKSFGNPNINYEYITFLNALNKIGSTYPPYELFKSSGRFVNRYFSNKELNNLANIINEDRPSGSILTSINLYALGGKVSKINKESTAFYYRDSRYILSLQSVWEDNIFKPENVKWMSKNFEYIYNITNGSYINFPFYPLKNYLSDYYGKNSSYLKVVKELYDPLNIFNFQQSIK